MLVGAVELADVGVESISGGTNGGGGAGACWFVCGIASYSWASRGVVLSVGSESSSMWWRAST